MTKRLYIAYGSNLNLRQMAMRCPTAQLVGTGEVRDYELQFKGAPYGAFATIGPKDGASVPVAVWSLRSRDEKALDIYEGVKAGHYFKKEIPVQLGDQTKLALVYIMNPEAQFGIPTQRYYNAVLEGYENCKLDPHILNKAVDESIAAFRQAEAQKRACLSLLDDFESWESLEEPVDAIGFDGQMHL